MPPAPPVTLLNEPAEIDAKSPLRERKKIAQWYHRADDAEHKLELLKHIITQQAERTIVFLKTRERLAELRAQLESAQIPCSWIQGEMPLLTATKLLSLKKRLPKASIK